VKLGEKNMHTTSKREAGIAGDKHWQIIPIIQDSGRIVAYLTQSQPITT
jgi:hypothetical protein